jgi:GNAT superfamily N-acetyltransferase
VFNQILTTGATLAKQHARRGAMAVSDLHYWCEMAEASASRELIVAVQESGGDTTLGAEWAEIGGAVAFGLRHVPHPFFNRVIGLGIARPATSEDVAAVDAFFRGLGHGWSAVQVAEDVAEPNELVGWVEAGGWTRGRRWPKLWRSLDGQLPVERADLPVRIERVGLDQAANFGRVVGAAFEMEDVLPRLSAATMGRPGWTHYLGFDGNEPVSAAALFVTAGVAWLGFGATLESHRGRGAQSAMFARRLADARLLGCRLAITETGEDTPEEPNPSYRNMLRVGFEVAYFRPNWNRRPAEVQPPGLAPPEPARPPLHPDRPMRGAP